MAAFNVNNGNSALPSTRHLLTSLINTIANSTQPDQQQEERDPAPTSNPLLNASANTKHALLTLHTLFPNDFLPALDLLDRGLVERLVLAPEHPDSNSNSNNSLDDRRSKRETPSVAAAAAYYVRSAQKHNSRSSSSRHHYYNSDNTNSSNVASTTTTQQQQQQHHLPMTTYDVRLQAWSCSCPAFAFAAFPATAAAAAEHSEAEHSEADEADEVAWLFGGLSRGSEVPVCKHLLACVIAERCEGWGGLVEEREVGVEEVCGWAAGWGD